MYFFQQAIANRLYQLEKDTQEEDEVSAISQAGDEEDEVFSKNNKRKKHADVGKRVEKKTRVVQEVKSLLQIMREEDDRKAIGAPSYASIAALPSEKAPRLFCSVCGQISKYSCLKCGARFCCVKCQETHKESRCTRIRTAVGSNSLHLFHFLQHK